VTAPDLVEVVAEVLRVHVKRNIKGCDCGWAELGKSHWEHQARAVLTALETVGTVEWGVAWEHISMQYPAWTSIYTSKELAQSKLGDSAFPGALVSRRTFPWERAE